MEKQNDKNRRIICFDMSNDVEIDVIYFSRIDMQIKLDGKRLEEIYPFK